MLGPRTLKMTSPLGGSSRKFRYTEELPQSVPTLDCQHKLMGLDENYWDCVEAGAEGIGVESPSARHTTNASGRAFQRLKLQLRDFITTRED